MKGQNERLGVMRKGRGQFLLGVRETFKQETESLWSKIAKRVFAR